MTKPDWAEQRAIHAGFYNGTPAFTAIVTILRAERRRAVRKCRKVSMAYQIKRMDEGTEAFRTFAEACSDCAQAIAGGKHG